MNYKIKFVYIIKFLAYYKYIYHFKRVYSYFFLNIKTFQYQKI